MYLPVSVYTSSTKLDSSNNGITLTKPDRLVIHHKDGFISEGDAKDHGYIILEELPAPFEGCPVRLKERGVKEWTMFGGNFVWSSDSRFSEKYPSPVPVHDRIEA